MGKGSRGKVLLAARHSVLEQLGLMHLATVARQEGYDPKIMLDKNGDFRNVFEEVRRSGPAYVGVQSFTGNHIAAYDFLDSIRGLGAETIIGGPHPTYFPEESAKHADYAVVSEGFDPFRRILRGEASKGIVVPLRKESFPDPDRKSFYNDHPEHRANPIKNVITSTGCPYSCTYCYNSSRVDGLVDVVDSAQLDRMKDAFGKNTRLFVTSQRPVSDVLREIATIRSLAPKTKMIYFQDDVFGASLDWLEEFARKHDGFPYHAQERFEYADSNGGNGGGKRLELLKSSGCTGITFAIESANPVVRREVLNRRTEQSLMFQVLEHASSLGLRVRTEQMLGLPLGATSVETPINIDADIETLALNVNLKEQTGLPDLAWASIFVPYYGTKLARDCERWGHSNLDMRDIPPSFFDKSTLKFPRNWVGPGLSPEDSSLWLPSDDQEKYVNDLSILRAGFAAFAHFPRGDEFARDFLDQPDSSLAGVGEILKAHLFDRRIYGTR